MVKTIKSNLKLRRFDINKKINGNNGIKISSKTKGYSGFAPEHTDR